MTTIGNYKLIKTIGSGGFSKVMLAENILSGEKCALKVMKNGKGRDYQYIQQMLKAEVSYLKELNHDNIIKVIDYSNKEVFINSRKSEIDVSYIATEYAENGEFFDYIAEGEKFSEKTARYFFHKLIDALDHVHSSGIAHRDIKPENLLLDSQFTLKLGDFGFCTKDKISKSKRGTLGYMAPEILAGSKYDAKKSDLFSTAVILFIMVTQHCPFIRADTNDRYYKKIIGNDMDEFWKFHSDFEGYSEEFKDLFCKMISVNPDDRLSIDEVREHKWFKGPLPLSSDIIFEFQLRKKALLSNNDNECTSDKKGENNEFLAENGKSSKTNNRSDSSSSSNSNSSSDDEDSKLTTDNYFVESGDDLIDIVTMFCQLKEYAFEKSTEYFRVIFKVNGEDETATIQADVCKNRKNASRNIEFILVSGSKSVLKATFPQLNQFLSEQLKDL